MIGLVVGMIRFGLEFGYTAPICGTGDELILYFSVQRVILKDE